MVAADVLPSNNGDARVEYVNLAGVDHSDDDDDDDSAFVTANDVSVEPLESSRKMSFSSPNVARAGVDEFISPILSRYRKQLDTSPKWGSHYAWLF